MKIYFVRSHSSDNYIMADCSDGIRCSNCAPDGRFAGVDLIAHSYADALGVVASILGNLDLCIDENDLQWMGDPCYSTYDEWRMDSMNDFGEDEAYLIADTDAIAEYGKETIPVGETVVVSIRHCVETGKDDVFEVFRPTEDTYDYRKNGVWTGGFDRIGTSEFDGIARLINISRLVSPCNRIRAKPTHFSVTVPNRFSEYVNSTDANGLLWPVTISQEGSDD